MHNSSSKKSKATGAFLFLLTLIIIISVIVISVKCPGLLTLKKAAAPAGLLKYKAEGMKYFPFADESSLGEWEEKIFKGKVDYKVEKNRDLSYVRARCAGAASALYYRIKMDARRREPVMGWRWRVEKFPDKKMPENLGTRDEDDFAARVYVIFMAPFFTNSKVLEYIWARDMAAGTVGTSPYSENIKIMVLKNGRAKEGEWFDEERDITADYKKMFGRSPEYDIGAVAFMTNTDHTGTEAVALYDEIKLGYRQ